MSYQEMVATVYGKNRGEIVQNVDYLVDVSKCRFNKVISPDYWSRDVLITFDNPTEVLKLNWSEDEINTLSDDMKEIYTDFTDFNNCYIYTQREWDDEVYFSVKCKTDKNSREIICATTYFEYSVFIKEPFIKYINNFLLSQRL